MDLEILEALALSDERTEALGQLLPGSEDHDYFKVLHAQHRGALDEAEPILEAWPGRHGATERLERLRVRQMLHRLGEDPARVAEDVRDQFGVSHWHEAEVDEADPSRPTQLAPGAFDGVKLLTEAVAKSADLSQVTADGKRELVEGPLGKGLDLSRRRALLRAVAHSASNALVDHVAKELEAGGAFGALAAHQQLTRAQLEALAGRVAKLRTDARWTDAMIRRMRPPGDVDLEHDLAARERYLRELWQFVAGLPPAAASLKAHVLWHLLDAYRRRDAAPDRALVLAYLMTPRSAPYVARTLVEHVRPQELAQLGADFRASTGLPPAGNDEELVRYFVYRDPSEASHYAQWLETAWLDAEIATAQLLSGQGNVDRATQVLGPARAAALRDRIELVWCAHNPARFGATDAVELDCDVKHVAELVVKVFRIDPLAYFQHHRREVSTDLDLDGLAASHELVMRFTEPPIRRVRRRIELPMCARPGTYVVDLIGNGMSSRAVICKGRLRHLVRIGAAGHEVMIFDDAGQPLAGARAWIGDREYTADARGSFIVPFSTVPGSQPMLLASGDIAVVRTLELVRETYDLHAAIHVDRQSLAEGGTARAIARVRLDVAGAPASLSLVEQPTWDITLTDRHGVTTTKQFPLVLTDDEACVLEWPLGEAPASVVVALRGKVKVLSEQREQELVATAHAEIASIHSTTATEALYLARTAMGWVLSALGKSGEPRAHRPVSVMLRHRWAHTQLVAELATDTNGRCVLGELPGLVSVAATLGEHEQSWQLDSNDHVATTVHARAGRDVLVPLPTGRSGADAVHRASLVELRAGVPAHHVQTTFEPLEGGIAIRGLAPGDYALDVPGWIRGVTIRVARDGAELAHHVITPTEIVELSRQAPVIAELATRDTLHVRVAGASARTRVHVIATRFFAAELGNPPRAGRGPVHRADRPRPVAYVSGRELGDEYRYVLERRAAKRFPSLQLDKPSLLLNPWSRRTTTTDVATARAGRVFTGAPAPMAAPAQATQLFGASGGAVDHAAYVGYDFVAQPPVVLANLELDDAGRVVVPLAELGRATCATIIVDDPSGTSTRRVALSEPALEPKDLRLRLALDPARHAAQQKAIAPLRAGDQLVIDDLATAKVHMIDSVERAHAYLLALRDDATLREFSFVTRWHQLGDSERRELYSKYACHELHLFLYGKDRAFFDAVIRPYLAHKRTKTFLDQWLLDGDLVPYLEPWRLSQLNAVERALLAQRLRDDPALVRVLGDAVEILAPDPARDTHLIDVLLGASRLDSSAALEGYAAEALDEAYAREEAEGDRMMAMPMAEAAPAASAPGGGGRRSSAPPPPAPKRAKKQEASGDDDAMDRDLERRQQAAPMFRAADRTQEWAENNWWHLAPAESDADLIEPHRFWRDLAMHERGSFLSPWLGLATTSFAEAMCALAVIDLPFVAGTHAIAADGPRLTISAATSALAGSSQLVDGPLVEGGPPLVVGQSYVRADDRYRYVDGEQVDNYVDGPFIAGVVYTCLVVLANPTSTRQRVAALVQTPRGSMALAGARPTQTLEVLLEPYGTFGHEYSFYFPAPGRYTHFPVHVTRGGTIVAAAPGRTLDVVTGGEISDPHSWSHVSQRGSLDEVVAFLGRANLADLDLDRIAWRLRDRAAYEAIVTALERRHVYDETVWGYALLHADRLRMRAWLRALGDQLLVAGPVLEMPLVELDGEALHSYEHLEYAPLTNARAHRLGAKHRILNEGLAAQYRRFLELVAHRRAPTAEDLLAGAAYLLAQDRNTEALALLARVRVDAVADRMQHDYLAAYAACLTGDVTRARELATRWRQLPVDRWRRKFDALANMLAELDGAGPAVADPTHREQQQAELAAKQPTFEIEVDRDGVVVHHQHVAALELRFFEMDVELLFSRQPFVQSDVSRFSFIEPGHREQLAGMPPEHRVAWPVALRGKNVVVEAVGAGLRKAKIHYANDLVTNLAHQYGQVRVQRASDRAALAATYVKVYAKQRGGAVRFYKDGYTDLRGWFDYATLSTNDLDNVERFAILVCSEPSGAAILEAGPPAR